MVGRVPLLLACFTVVLLAAFANVAHAQCPCPGGSFRLDDNCELCQLCRVCTGDNIGGCSSKEGIGATTDTVCSEDSASGDNAAASASGGGGSIQLGPVVGAAVAGIALIVLAVVLGLRHGDARRKVGQSGSVKAPGGGGGAVVQDSEDGGVASNIARNSSRAFQRATMTSADREVRSGD